MWYNVYIMKKYYLIIILSALTLCGCEKEKPPEYVYHEHTPLTIVTTATTVPADTYSEYMETYTPPTTTGTDVYYYHLPPTVDLNGGRADIAQIDIPPMDKPQLDTAARLEKAARPDVSADNGTTAVTTVPENSGTEETSTASPTFTIQLPETDKVHIQTVPADTAPTEFVPETTTETTLPSE
ncbi:MAG: hypothetical protein J6K17_08040 [Oscillospiraceae bacterium]|nr:hypothetical protein [Oscillospiraceae bacterium]